MRWEPDESFQGCDFSAFVILEKCNHVEGLAFGPGATLVLLLAGRLLFFIGLDLDDF
jgi:hypothetical protein